MTICKIEDLTVSELKERLKDKIKSSRKLEAKIEMLYQVGAYDYADSLDIASGVEIESIIEIENLLKQKNKKVTQTTWQYLTSIV